MEKFFSENIPIEGLDYEIGKYLYSLFVSICNVDISYLHYAGNNDDEDIEHVERAFAYELYHQWCNYPIIKNNKKLVINAEIPKELISEVKHINDYLSYPDILLHHGQGQYTGNIIVCEIKRKKYAEQNHEKVFHDFEKLKLYLSNELRVKKDNKLWEPFKLGVFILTIKEDENEPQISVSQIKKCIDDEDYRKLCAFEPNISQRIICVVYNGKELIYDTLYELTNGR